MSLSLRWASSLEIFECITLFRSVSGCSDQRATDWLYKLVNPVRVLYNEFGMALKGVLHICPGGVFSVFATPYGI